LSYVSISTSSTNIVPDSGDNIPVNVLTNVLFPEPDSPIIAILSPLLILKLKLSKIYVSDFSYLNLILLNEIVPSISFFYGI
jgi:hypothetical protein